MVLQRGQTVAEAGRDVDHGRGMKSGVKGMGMKGEWGWTRRYLQSGRQSCRGDAGRHLPEHRRQSLA